MQLISSQVLPGGIVFLKISGDLSADALKDIAAGLNENLQMIKDQFLTTGGKTFHMTDMSEFTGKYDPEVLELFMTFAKGTREMVQKSVIYGGNLSTELIAKLVIMVSGRTDIEIFHTHDEAVAALRAAGAIA
jgi:hypothetical protein